MTSVLFIIAPVSFRDEELLIPRQILSEAGYTCLVASLTLEPCVGMLGATVTPDLLVSSVNLDDFSCVVMVGGSGVTEIFEDKRLLELFDDAYRKGLLLGGICLGPMVLARSGILRGKQATVYKTEQSLAVLRDSGCAYQPDDLVLDGRVLTASGPEHAKAFGKKLLELLFNHGTH